MKTLLLISTFLLTSMSYAHECNNHPKISPELSKIELLNPRSFVRIANGVDEYKVKITLRDNTGRPVVGVRPEFSSNVGGDFLSQPLEPSNKNGVTVGSITTLSADSRLNVPRLLEVSSPQGLNTLTTFAPFSE